MEVGVFACLGFILLVLGFWLFYAFPAHYLFFGTFWEKNASEKNEEEFDANAISCAISHIILVGAVTAFVCYKYGVPLDSDEFMTKWLPISLGGLSAVLYIGCIIRALIEHFS